MTSRKPLFDNLKDTTRQACINKIIAYSEDNLVEPLGVIGAEQLLDLVLEAIHPDIYNQGLKDAQTALEGKLADLSVELDLMIRR